MREEHRVDAQLPRGVRPHQRALLHHWSVRAHGRHDAVHENKSAALGGGHGLQRGAHVVAIQIVAAALALRLEDECVGVGDGALHGRLVGIWVADAVQPREAPQQPCRPLVVRVPGEAGGVDEDLLDLLGAGEMVRHVRALDAHRALDHTPRRPLLLGRVVPGRVSAAEVSHGGLHVAVHVISDEQSVREAVDVSFSVDVRQGAPHHRH
mmetsp:Transcript_17200/g.29729  ORF Transcript_17200/g.29729 Transcript_17200/m.29729 type:complete len:209 (+) Transcript_17200:528-1154(+)